MSYRLLLVMLLLVPVALYYGVVAFAPALLAGTVGPWPRSLCVGLGLFVWCVAVTFAYCLKAPADATAGERA
ncbi:hypothetical protein Ga0061063_0638 [Gulbenkiania indica]|uniref:Uncharacterized protein n=1 Tax=Gulbenkiania indica TaxID=375574 RepID=A0A0K6GT33_9NEIS|nr:DUF485 domain-containing protein [Gulbenkiania indica]CUA81792.1 hypothetical protein Ga0061063_0638 [Gulbenkiania indica]